MASRLLVIFNIVNLLFLLVGGLFLGFAIKSSMIIAETPTEYNVAERILLAECNRNGELPIDRAACSSPMDEQTSASSNSTKHATANIPPSLAIIANACFIIATFLISIPALSLPLNRGWLRLHGWLVMFCAAFTLIVGLTLWFKTLTTRNMLAGLWESQSQQVQSFLQQRVCMDILFPVCIFAMACGATDAPRLKAFNR